MWNYVALCPTSLKGPILYQGRFTYCFFIVNQSRFSVDYPSIKVLNPQRMKVSWLAVVTREGVVLKTTNASYYWSALMITHIVIIKYGTFITLQQHLASYNSNLTNNFNMAESSLWPANNAPVLLYLYKLLFNRPPHPSAHSLLHVIQFELDCGSDDNNTSHHHWELLQWHLMSVQLQLLFSLLTDAQ